MKKFSKYIVFAVIAILCLVFTACNGNNDIPADTEVSGSETQASETITETTSADEQTEAETESGTEADPIDVMLSIQDPAGTTDNTALIAEHEDSGITLWFNHSYTKTAADDVMPTGLNTYRMRMAKNEIEDCHVLLAVSEEHTGLTVSISNFKNANGAELVTDLMYGYYFDDIDGKSLPDPTPWVREGKTFDLTPGRSQLFIVKVHTAENSAEGLYEAVFKVQDAEGREIKKAAVSVYVWNFTLPEATSCKTQMDLSWYNIYAAHKCYEGDDSVLYCNYYDYLLENRICAYTLPYDTKGEFSDSRIVKYLDSQRVVAFNPLGWKTEANAGNVSSAYAFLSQKQEWLDKAYFYCVDEPSNKADLDRINAVGDILKANFPGYKMMSPMHMNGAMDAKSTSDFFTYIADSINVWCIKPFFFTTYDQYKASKSLYGKKLTYLNTQRLEKTLGTFEDRMAAEKAGGDEIWWYVVHEPEYPEINLVIETQAVRYRILFWQQKLYHVDSFLYYLTNDWCYIGEKAGLDPKHEVNSDLFDVYGNGILVWCGAPFGEYGPVGSLRLECVRDGIEDFEYLTMLEKQYGQETVDAIISRLTTSLAEYNTDEEFFTALRTAVGNLVESISVNQ